MKNICKKLLVDDKVMDFLALRRLNQDHVENLHALIRSAHGPNDHPKAHKYVSAIRKLACNALISELFDYSRHPPARHSQGVENMEGNGTSKEARLRKKANSTLLDKVEEAMFRPKIPN